MSVISLSLADASSHAFAETWLLALSPSNAFSRGEQIGREENTDDLSDVQASLDGDEEAYARIVRRYQNQIAGRMWKFTNDRQMLEELVQEVFVEAYFSLSGYKGKGSFGGWVNTIATRTGYRHWKRQKQGRQVVSLEDWDGATTEDASDGLSETSAVLRKLLSQLNPRDRLVLTLLYWEEYSVAEIAQQTGWSQTMVKVQAYRARKRLKKLLEKANIDGEVGDVQ